MKNGASVKKGVKRQELREREGVLEGRITGRDKTRRTVVRKELDRDGTEPRTGHRRDIL